MMVMIMMLAQVESRIVIAITVMRDARLTPSASESDEEDDDDNDCEEKDKKRR